MIFFVMVFLLSPWVMGYLVEKSYYAIYGFVIGAIMMGCIFEFVKAGVITVG